MTNTIGRQLRKLPGGGLSVAAAWSIVGSLGGAAGRFALQVAIANLLSPAGYGRFVTLRTCGELASAFPNRGFQSIVVRSLPGYAIAEDGPNYRGLIRYSWRSTLAWGVVLAVAGVAVGAVIEGRVGFTLLVAMATIPAWAMLRLTQALLQAQDRFVTGNFIGQMLQPGLVAVCLAVVWLVYEVDVRVALAAMLVSLVASTVIAAWRTEKRTRELVGRGPAGPADPDWGRSARSFYVGQLAIAVIGMADVLILALFVSPVEVGLYSMASRIAIMGRMANSGLESIVSPRIAKAWASDDLPGLQRIVSQSIALSSVPTIGFAVFLTIFREPVLGIVGDEFRAAGTYLVLLLIGNVVNALTGPSGYVVSLTGNERLHARIMTLSAIALVVGCFVAGPVAGTLGVAIVRSLVNVGWNLVLVVVARRELGIRCYPSRAH